MRINVTFRHLEPADSLRNYAEQRLKKLKKYADGPMDVNVVLSVEKFRHTAEVVVSADGVRATATEQQGDMHSAIDLVSDKIDKQLRRFREKLRNKKGAGNKPIGQSVRYEVLAADEGQQGPHVIRAERLEAKPMSVEEAIAQLQLLNQDFFVFTNAEQETVNVLYRRKDGTLGLIEPERP